MSTFRQKLGRLHLDRGDTRRTLFLAGTGRSGTTWLEEMLNWDGAYRVMFEPFHTGKVAALRGWRYRQYLRPEERGEQYLRPARKILSGRIRSHWIDRYNTQVFPDRRLIKEIRANLFLRWIRAQFPEIPLLLLLRHPCAVALSKLRLGWKTDLRDFLDQVDLMGDHLAPFRRALESAADPFEQHVFLWCVENYVPLRQFRPGEIHVTFYEDVVAGPERSLREGLAFIGAEFSPRMLEAHGRPSSLSHRTSAVSAGTDPLESWRSGVSPEQAARAGEILAMFGLDAVYGQGSRPLVTGDEALRLFS